MKGLIKIIVIYLIRFFIRIIYIFPIKNNRIIFSSYRGQQFACNPKYISLKLSELAKDKVEIIWAFCNPEKYTFLEEKGVKLVKYNSIKRLYYEATSKISINNIGSFSYLPLREGQEHVNTWHSGLDLECCGMNEKENDQLTKYSIELSGKETSLFLSANQLFTDYSVKVQFGYDGYIMNGRLPRGDILLSAESYDINLKVRKQFSIDEKCIIVMYAPTWRYGGAAEMPYFDFTLLSEKLEEKYGDNFVMLNRSHHLIADVKEIDNNHFIDVTEYPDVQELVISSDIIISDYSSILWDGALSKCALVQYVPDAEDFEQRRGLYVPVDCWGLPIARSMSELVEIIGNMNLESSKVQSQNLLNLLGSYETGIAAELCCTWILNKCGLQSSKDKFEDYLIYNDNSADESIINKMRHNNIDVNGSDVV